MDILYWINHNKNVALHATQKMFFKKYLCRLQIYCPGGRSIFENDLRTSLEQRKNLSKSINPGGSWFSRNTRFLVDADAAQLSVVRDLLANKDIKVRVEEPTVSIYAESESRLKEIIELFDHRFHDRVRTVSVPKNVEHAELLTENKILKRSRRNQYRYKVVLKDGRVDPARKINILNYLLSLGDIISIPKAAISMLENRYSGFWGIYYYTNDPSINTFVELIEPGVVANVYEIVVVE